MRDLVLVIDRTVRGLCEFPGEYRRVRRRDLIVPGEAENVVPLEFVVRDPVLKATFTTLSIRPGIFK